jgi:hypothetical protein
MRRWRAIGNGVVQNRKWRATADEDGHYCFAVALRSHGPEHAPIGRTATAFDLAPRPGCRPYIATWSAYPSIAAAPINPGIDVMCHWRSSGARNIPFSYSLMLAPNSTTGGVCANRPQ